MSEDIFLKVLTRDGNHPDKRHHQLHPTAQVVLGWESGCCSPGLLPLPMAPPTQPAGNYDAQRVDVGQRAVLALNLSPALMSPQGWDCFQLVSTRDGESAHQAVSYGRWTLGLLLHPSLLCSRQRPPPPCLAILHPIRIDPGCLLHDARVHICHENHQRTASGLRRILLNR